MLKEGRNYTAAERGAQRSKKAGWRLGFVRVLRGSDGKARKLVILEAKYYCARWKDGSISGQMTPARVASWGMASAKRRRSEWNLARTGPGSSRHRKLFAAFICLRFAFQAFAC